MLSAAFSPEIFHESFPAVKVSDRRKEHHARVEAIQENLLLPAIECLCAESQSLVEFRHMRLHNLRVRRQADHVNLQVHHRTQPAQQVDSQYSVDSVTTCASNG